MPMCLLGTSSVTASVVRASRLSAVAVFVMFLLFARHALATSNELTGDEALKLAIAKWEHYSKWDGPDKTKLSWVDNGSALISDRTLEGAHYLRHFSMQSGDETRPCIAIRNPQYAAWIENRSGRWFLHDMAYAGDVAYDRYSREAGAPWVTPFYLPGQGAIVDLVSRQDLILDSFSSVTSDIYRFRFSPNSPELKKRVSIVEIDASSQSDWFPQRFHWVRAKGNGSYSHVSANLVRVGEHFVPTRIDLIDESSQSVQASAKLTIEDMKAVNPKECFLEYYDLGEVVPPKKRKSNLDWSLIVVSVMVAAMVLAVAFRVRGRKSP